MSNAIYITTAEPHCGKSLVSLGVVEMLLRKTQRVGIFRPVINGSSSQGRDKNINLLLTHFNLDLAYEDTYAFHKQQIVELSEQDRVDEVLDHIIAKYKKLESMCDAMVCIGSDFLGEGAAFEFDFNTSVAKNLGCPVLIVGRADHRDIETTVSTIHTTYDTFLAKECQIIGTIINRAEPDAIADLLDKLHQIFPEPDQFVSVMPNSLRLNSPTVQELADQLGAKILYGEDQLRNQVFNYLVVASQPQHFLPRLQEKMAIITPGDRGDVVFTALQAHVSRNYPQLSAIVLTVDLLPDPATQRLLDGIPNIIPILAVESDTYETVTQTYNIRSYINPTNIDKIRLGLLLFEAYVDIKSLEKQISNVRKQGITPKMFIYNMVQQAKAKKRRIVLPEGYDHRILKAADYLTEHEIVDVTLLGLEHKIKASIKKLGLRMDADRVQIIDPARSPKFDEYVQTLYQLRKHKGWTVGLARDLMRDVSYYGTMMVYKGDADGMVSGAAHTTKHTITPGLQFVKTKPDFSVVSSVFFMCLDDRVLVYGDCAVNPNPTAEQLAEIAISSAETGMAFGIEPKIAMLSYSSGESGTGEDVERVRQATKLAQARRPDLKIEGPIQYDAAVDPEVGAKKLPNSEVAGQATIFIFPDLNTGNNTYKAVQRETGAIAIGPVLQGLRKPVNDLSRGCTVEDIINTVVITVLQAE